MTKVLSSSKLFWLLTAPTLSLFIFLTVFGSRILINPAEIEITPCGDVLMFRTYPLVDFLGIDYPMVRYVTTVTPLTPETNNGYVCREDNGMGNRYNHDHNRGFGEWSLNHYAEPCMVDPIGFKINIQYTALLFDVIPLRPVAVSTIVACLDTEWEKCNFTTLR